MSQFNRFLNQLDQMGADKPAPSYPHIAPRKFPRKEYKKVNRHLWALIVGLILLTGAGASAGGFYWQQHLTANTATTAQQQTAKPSKAVSSRSRTASGQISSADRLVQPDAVQRRSRKPSGQRLLKIWLDRLNYSRAKDRDIMSIYQQATPPRKQQIDQQLRAITASAADSAAKLQQVRGLLRQYRMIDQITGSPAGTAAVSPPLTSRNPDRPLDS